MKGRGIFNRQRSKIKYVKSIKLGDALTKTETETMGYIMDGLTYKEVASHIDCSPSTVKFHIRNVLKKYGAKNKTHAAAIHALSLCGVKPAADSRIVRTGIVNEGDQLEIFDEVLDAG